MHPRTVLSLGNFFCAAQFFLVLYVIAPYLATFIPQSSTGFVIAIGSVFSLLSFPFIPRLVCLIGTKRLAILCICIAFLSLVLLSVLHGVVAAIVLIALFSTVQPAIGYLLDLLLEATVTSEEDTGRVRTAFITCASAALIAAPLAVGFLLGPSDDYARVFTIAALSLLPALFLLISRELPEGEPPSFSSMREVLSCLLNDPDFRAVGIAYSTLQFFYHLAPFFIPLYLHNVLGFPWSDLGWMFAVALLPFVLLEYPVGWIADRAWGDRELMALGFLIMGSAFASVSFITSATPLLSVLMALLVTRVGAAVAEATTEAHFFRRVSEKDANSVGVFRMMRPMGALIAPVVGSLFLVYSTYDLFFYICGLGILIIGVASALSIRDVR